jgi:glycosyltransferase involved in cell wall biosynthesis
MSFSFNAPLGEVSFGQVSTLLLRGFFSRDLHPNVFVIGQNPTFSSQKQDQAFFSYVNQCIGKAHESHSRDTPCLKLWHLNQGMDSFSKTHYLFTFYELDQPTSYEINVAKNCDKLIFTNNYTKDVFDQFGVESEVVPLAFDSFNFKKLNKNYFDDDRIVFNLSGKFEKRKHHEKIIRAWSKKFGNNKKYYLQCSLYNPFLNEQLNKQNFVRSLDGKSSFNIQFLGHMPTNELYNDYLNSGDIIIGMSGAEGWGLPEFQSTAIGKHSVILDAHGYKEWANEENSTLVQPNGKIEAYDGLFFKPNQPYNQGNIYDFSEDDFISACEEAIKKTESNKINESGLKIQKDFSLDNTLDKLLSIIG